MLLGKLQQLLVVVTVVVTYFRCQGHYQCSHISNGCCAEAGHECLCPCCYDHFR